MKQIEVFKIKSSQINQKWKKNFKLDEYYFHNLSFLLDMKVLFLTFLKFLTLSKKIDLTKEPKLLEKYIN